MSTRLPTIKPGSAGGRLTSVNVGSQSRAAIAESGAARAQAEAFNTLGVQADRYHEAFAKHEAVTALSKARIQLNDWIQNHSTQREFGADEVPTGVHFDRSETITTEDGRTVSRQRKSVKAAEVLNGWWDQFSGSVRESAMGGLTTPLARAHVEKAMEDMVFKGRTEVQNLQAKRYLEDLESQAKVNYRNAVESGDLEILQATLDASAQVWTEAERRDMFLQGAADITTRPLYEALQTGDPTAIETAVQGILEVPDEVLSDKEKASLAAHGRREVKRIQTEARVAAEKAAKLEVFNDLNRVIASGDPAQMQLLHDRLTDPEYAETIGPQTAISVRNSLRIEMDRMERETEAQNTADQLHAIYGFQMGIDDGSPEANIAAFHAMEQAGTFEGQPALKAQTYRKLLSAQEEVAEHNSMLERAQSLIQNGDGVQNDKNDRKVADAVWDSQPDERKNLQFVSEFTQQTGVMGNKMTNAFYRAAQSDDPEVFKEAVLMLRDFQRSARGHLIDHLTGDSYDRANLVLSHMTNGATFEEGYNNLKAVENMAPNERKAMFEGYTFRYGKEVREMLPELIDDKYGGWFSNVTVGMNLEGPFEQLVATQLSLAPGTSLEVAAAAAFNTLTRRWAPDDTFGPNPVVMRYGPMQVLDTPKEVIREALKDHLKETIGLDPEAFDHEKIAAMWRPDVGAFSITYQGDLGAMETGDLGLWRPDRQALKKRHEEWLLREPSGGFALPKASRERLEERRRKQPPRYQGTKAPGVLFQNRYHQIYNPTGQRYE